MGYLNGIDFVLGSDKNSVSLFGSGIFIHTVLDQLNLRIGVKISEPVETVICCGAT